jgi:hypothetical protein
MGDGMIQVVLDALREHLRRLHLRTLEERDRHGYETVPQDAELARWESEAAWPTL